MTRSSADFLFTVLVSLGGFADRISAQVGTALHQRKISALEGGFTGPIGPSSYFAYDLEALGDLSGDGTIELAAVDAGANLWILSLGSDGRVVREKRITHGGEW